MILMLKDKKETLKICLFGVLRRFQHCTGHITTGSWKGRGNQYIEFARVVYCKLPTNGKQLPAFPLTAMTGIEPRLQRWEARVLPLCHRGPETLKKSNSTFNEQRYPQSNINASWARFSNCQLSNFGSGWVFKPQNLEDEDEFDIICTVICEHNCHITAHPFPLTLSVVRLSLG